MTNGIIQDCDGDGVTNGDEIADGTDLFDVCDYEASNQDISIVTDEWLNSDCDADGVTNGDEVLDGTDPLDSCSVVVSSQTSMPNGAWDVLDCDGDGVPNGLEIVDGTDPTDPCDLDPLSQDITTVTTDWEALDCDGDGILNGDEPGDENGNGIPDFLEVNNGDPNATDGLEVFEIMTPNGDGLNDVFVIRGISQYPNNTVRIYNRWGVLVYDTEGYGQNDNYFRERVRVVLPLTKIVYYLSGHIIML